MASTQRAFHATWYGAWSQFLSFTQTNSIGITYSTLTISWTRGALPQGSSIKWTFTDVASPIGTSTIEVFCQDLHSTIGSPLAYIMGPLVGLATIRKQITPGAAITPDQYCAAILATLGLVLVDVCGATLVVGAAIDAPGTNPSFAWGALLSMLAYTDADMWPFTVFVVSETAKWGNVIQYSPGAGLYALAGQQIAIQQLGQQTSQLLPDFEVGINNGSTIYSVSTNTFTEP